MGELKTGSVKKSSSYEYILFDEECQELSLPKLLILYP